MARFWVGGGSSTNWSATSNTNWATASGGAGNQTVPDVTQAVTFDGAGSGNGASVVSANISCLSLTFTSGYTNTITINTAVSLTVAGSVTDHTNHTWVVSGTGTMTISATATITSGGKTFPGPVTFSGAATTKTLSGNWTITGTLTITASVTINATVAETLSSAGLTLTAVPGSGTAKLILTGGSWTSAANDIVQNDIDIAGNVTISGTVYFQAKTLTYVSGTPVTTSSTLQVGAATTFNTNGMSFSSITLTGSVTYTINSLLSASGILTINSGVTATFAGTAGFSVATFTLAHTGGGTATFKNGITYTVTTALNCFLSRNGAPMVLTSDDGTLKTVITLNNGATCNVCATFTRVDASNGRAIYTFNGTVTTCTNVFAFNDALPPAIGRVIHAGATY